MSTSEHLRCAPKYTISRLNNQKFSGKGHPTISGAIAPKYFPPELRLPQELNPALGRRVQDGELDAWLPDIVAIEPRIQRYRTTRDFTTRYRTVGGPE